MSSTSRSGSTGASLETLRQACERNVPIELQYMNTAGELLVAKARVLGVDDEAVYLDSPQSIGRSVKFRRNQSLEAHFALQEGRYSFRSSVLDLRCIVQLNEVKRVVGMVIRCPRKVALGQRRNHFRVSVIGEEPIEPELHTAVPDGQGACPIDAHFFRATLLNLSVGGAALRVAAEDARPLSVNEQLFLTFFLPEEDREFFFLVEVRQMRKVAEGTAVRMGVKIKPWPSRGELKRTQDRLQQYINEVQRQQLRRAG